MVAIAQCWQHPNNHRQRIFTLTDSDTGDSAHYLIAEGKAVGQPVDIPTDFHTWFPCDGAPDRHVLELNLVDIETVSVSDAQLISDAFDAVDAIITGPNLTTTVAAAVTPIDGPNQILAQAAPYAIHQDRTVAYGIIELDTADTPTIDSSVIVHELLHVLGFANIPGLPFHDYVQYDDIGNLVFTGPAATDAWQTMGGTGNPPLYEPDGGSHWDEDTLLNEIQTPFSDGPANILSALTLGALIDIGYKVNRSAADRYNLRDALTTNICRNCTIARNT